MIHWIEDRVDSDTIDTGAAASGGQEVGTIHHRFIATPAPAHCQVVILTKFSSFYIYSTFIYVLTFN